MAAPAEPAKWGRPLEPVSVSEAVRSVLETIADAPDALGEGYQYLLTRLPGAALPAGAVRPGVQLGLVLSDALCDPDLNNPEWEIEVPVNVFTYVFADIYVYIYI